MKKTLFVITGLALILVTSSVMAQPSQAEIDAFRLYKQAQAAMEIQEWDNAIELLNQAWVNFRMPQIALLKARALQSKGDLETALLVLRGIGDESPKIRKAVDAQIAEIEALLSKPFEMDVTSPIDQVRMVIDKTSTFFIPGKIKVTPGQHRVEFSAPGYRTKIEEKTFSPGETSMTVVMDPVGGRVILTTDLDSFFGMIVKIDDRELMPSGTSMTPSRTSPIEIPAGTHTYTCMKNGLPDYTGTFSLVSSQVLEVECRMAPAGTVKKKKSGTGYSWKTWTLFSVGSALAVGGIALTGQYWYGNSLPKAEQNDYRVLEKSGYWAPAIAGIGVAMAIMSFFVFPEEKPEKTGPTYGFSVGPMNDGAAAALAVTF